jgi:hypothetical protein
MPLFFTHWLRGDAPLGNCPDLTCYEEIVGSRPLIEAALCDAITDQLIGLELLERLVGPGPRAAAVERIPKSAREMSGDLGEILAARWVEECTPFHVPVKRLRYKADREFPMQGDDLVALSEDEAPRLLKGEAKSRGALDRSTVESADKALNDRDGRPKPETLGFLSILLRDRGEDEWAERVEAFLDGCEDQSLEHLLFTFSGTDRRDLLEPVASSQRPAIRRHVASVVVPDHQTFIREAFNRVAEALRA